MRDVVNQLTEYKPKLVFTDENGNAVTPDKSTYRIDDVITGNAITGNNETAWVEFTPSDSTHIITVTANENRMLSNNTQRELRVLTANVIYGSNQIMKIKTEWWVERLDYALKT